MNSSELLRLFLPVLSGVALGLFVAVHGFLRARPPRRTRPASRSSSPDSTAPTSRAPILFPDVGRRASGVGRRTSQNAMAAAAALRRGA